MLMDTNCSIFTSVNISVSAGHLGNTFLWRFIFIFLVEQARWGQHMERHSGLNMGYKWHQLLQQQGQARKQHDENLSWCNTTMCPQPRMQTQYITSDSHATTAQALASDCKAWETHPSCKQANTPRPYPLEQGPSLAPGVIDPLLLLHFTSRGITVLVTQQRPQSGLTVSSIFSAVVVTLITLCEIILRLTGAPVASFSHGIRH